MADLALRLKLFTFLSPLGFGLSVQPSVRPSDYQSIRLSLMLKSKGGHKTKQNFVLVRTPKESAILTWTSLTDCDVDVSLCRSGLEFILF